MDTFSLQLILLTYLVISNWVFAAVCAWMEGVMDDTFYYTQTIAGYEKHKVYMVLRGCYWAVNCYLIAKSFNGMELLFAEAVMVPVFLLHFRFVHDGIYHLTRNNLNRAVSPLRFKQDDDGLSGSFWDTIMGHTYLHRLQLFSLGLALYACLLAGLGFGIIKQL